jgi:hypothetical protein
MTRIWKQLVSTKKFSHCGVRGLFDIFIFYAPALLPTAISRTEPSAPQTPGGSTITNYAPITIRIDYVVESPSAGVVFVEPDADIAPYVSPLRK